MIKAILQSGPVQATLGALLAGYMSLVKATTRWERRGLEHAEPVWESGRGVVGCVWHSRILMTIAVWPKTAQTPAILISRSRDGDVVADAARRHGVGVVRGSSLNQRKTGKQKGSVGAFREMARHVETGGCMAVTPDGPRGPRMRAGAGAIKLARTAQAPVLPCAWSTSRAIVFNSWDRFMLPLPFARGVIVYAEPISLDAGADEHAIKAAAQRLEEALNAATAEADKACGREVTEPAERRS
ncbi:MAG: lysophospholipid acyltransferase family protein [Alphaproteobacteria bacterium]|nr:lysophospholipid acyltransferase family protein [Alphaproteobacteria bacterium]